VVYTSFPSGSDRTAPLAVVDQSGVFRLPAFLSRQPLPERKRPAADRLVVANGGGHGAHLI